MCNLPSARLQRCLHFVPPGSPYIICMQFRVRSVLCAVGVIALRNQANPLQKSFLKTRTYFKPNSWTLLKTWYNLQSIAQPVSPLLNQSIDQAVADEPASPSLNQLKAQINPTEALKAFQAIKDCGIAHAPSYRVMEMARKKILLDTSIKILMNLGQ